MTTPTTPPRPTPPREISLIEGVCAHEYGHALIAAVVGIRTRNVRVGETLLGREAWGAVEVYYDDETTHAREYAMMLIGGVRATGLWLHLRHGYPRQFAMTWGASSGCNDLRKFREFSRTGKIPFDSAAREVDAVLEARYPQLLRAVRVLAERRKMHTSRLPIGA